MFDNVNRNEEDGSGVVQLMTLELLSLRINGPEILSGNSSLEFGIKHLLSGNNRRNMTSLTLQKSMSNGLGTAHPL